jgi:hypothetical protein
MSCTVVETSAFQQSGLTDIVIPAGCEIGEYAFYRCTCLTAVTISAGATQIGNFTFSGCSALTSVTLPSTLKWIGVMAFGWCGALATLAVPKACKLASDAFVSSPTQVTLS